MTDPITPPVLIIDPDRSFRTWHISEIYVPGNAGRYVPNPDDLVIDYTEGFFRVTAVDYTTGISTLVKWILPKTNPDFNDEDILLGAGPGLPSESFRALIDTSVMPHSLALDSRLRVYGTTNSYIKVFKGRNVGMTGEVISAFYDQNGTFMGENIPLELVATEDQNNIAIKAPMVGHTLRQFPDGEVVTAVVYDDVGQPRSVNPLLVLNTAFIRTTDAASKFIIGISLESPFLSSTDPTLLEYPINMPVQGLNIMGVVSYSDGSKLRLPVDGTKFSLYGLDNYIASIQGQQVPLVLSYRLSQNEYNYIGVPSPNGHISVPYKATTLESDGAYSVKLFAYPVWVSQLVGYRLEYYLCNLDRDTIYPVTNLVEMATGSRAFDPIEYGTVQRITVAVDLNRVDPQFAAYRHAQTFEITLLRDGDSTDNDNWTVGFDPGQDPAYGVGLRAVSEFINVGNWELDLTSEIATKEEWLEQVFYATKPLFDPGTELRAPEPNFFVVVTPNGRVELPIEMWNTKITVEQAPAEGKSVFIEFLRRGATTDLQLGVSALITHQRQAG